MSTALLTARDGITGYWDGKHKLGDLNGVLLPGDAKYLDDVRSPYQAFLLETLMKAQFGFAEIPDSDGKTHGAQLKLGGQTLTSLTRPSQAYFAAQLEWLRAYADLRDDRIPEIFMQLKDLMSFFGSQFYLDDGRRKYTLMMLNVTRELAIHIETFFKFGCRAARPIDYAPQVQPIIQTPNHSSFPSGHAVESFAVAAVLHRLQSGKGPETGISGSNATGEISELPFRFAHRMSTNRTVAGVHFPIDSQAGAYIGCLIADAIWSLASGKAVQPRDLTLPDGDDEGMRKDFLLSEFDMLKGKDGKMPVPVTPLPIVTEIWNRAAGEWPGAPADTSKADGED